MFSHSHSHSIKDHPKQAAGVAGAAAAVGAVGAILMTPRRGSEVRHEVRQRTAKAKHKLAAMKHNRTAGTAANATTERGPESASPKRTTRGKVEPTTKDAPKRNLEKVADEIRRKGEP